MAKEPLIPSFVCVASNEADGAGYDVSKALITGFGRKLEWQKERWPGPARVIARHCSAGYLTGGKHVASAGMNVGNGVDLHGLDGSRKAIRKS